LPPRALEELRSFTDYEQKLPHVPREAFALERFRRVLDDLGRPHLGRTTVHVTGTKGKGATTTFADAVLRAHGVRTFRFLSPHVTSFGERVAIDGAPLSDAAFDATFDRARAAFAAAVARGEPPTFFEALTAIGFLAAREAGVDADVLEVGLGGRLDATNVCEPVAAAITCVDLDHQKLLGDTIEKIAAEKAGIVKEGVPIYFGGGPGDPAFPVVAERARSMRAPLRRVGDWIDVESTRVGRLQDGRLGAVFSGRAGPLRLVDAAAPGGGAHQPTNALLGLALAADALTALRRSVDAETATRALATVDLPGRAEEIPGAPTFVVDGAHTPRSLAALFDLVRAAHPKAPLVLLGGATEERDPKALFAPARAVVERAFFGPIPSARTAEPEACARAWRALGGVAEAFASVEAAAEAAARAATPEGVVVVAGSFYLAGAVLSVLRRGARR
jgi:dihydrofolate synthase / folylpolyglutamate synthase